jgi:hypothetical protein
VFLEVRKVFRLCVPLWYRGRWSQCLHRVFVIFWLVFARFVHIYAMIVLLWFWLVLNCCFLCWSYMVWVFLYYLGFILGRFAQLGHVHVRFRSIMVILSDDCISKT